jgi:hypothetical protein
MKLETAKLIADADGTGDVEVYEGYSGRGMYGDETTGITGPESDLVAAIARAGVDLEPGSDEANSFVDDLSNVRYDNMARDTIFY